MSIMNPPGLLDETGTRSVKRAAEILRLLGRSREGCTLTDLARGSDLSKATAYRIVQTLLGEKLVAFDREQGRYTIGGEFVRIAMSARQYERVRVLRSLEKLSVSAMRALRDRTGETVALVVREGDYRTNVAVSLGTHELIAVPKVGAQLPLHLGGPGKLLLAALPSTELETLAQRSRLSQHGFAFSDAFRAALRQVRETGYATSFGEAIDGQASIAFAVRQRGVIIAALNLIVPTVRFSEATQTMFVPHVRTAAAEITALVEGAFNHEALEGE